MKPNPYATNIHVNSARNWSLSTATQVIIAMTLGCSATVAFFVFAWWISTIPDISPVSLSRNATVDANVADWVVCFFPGCFAYVNGLPNLHPCTVICFDTR